MRKLIFIFLLTAIHSFSQGVWTQKASFPGTPRGDAFYFSIGSIGFVGAGADANTNNLNDFWQYDVVNNSWMQKANFGGQARWQSSAFNIGSNAYIGMGTSDSGYENDFWEYNPTADVWTQKASIPAEGRTATIGFSIGNKGYIGTGWGGVSVSTLHHDFWEYDPILNFWTQKADVPGDRAYAVGFSIGTKGYVGTRHDNFGNYIADFFEYDPSTDIWTQKANFGGGFRTDIDGAHFTIGNYGYVGTGMYPSAVSTFNDFWRYDPTNDTWSRIPNLPAQSRIGAIGFSINNTGYVGMGYYWLNNVPNALNDLWSFTDTTIHNESNIFIPSAFSPNGDGQNDVLFVHGEKIKQINLKIYDRIGEKIFESTDTTKGWDGTYGGEKMNNATFVYYLTVWFTDGTTETKKGDVSLIR